MKGQRASISVTDLVDRHRRGGQRLPFEIGAFVALEVAERLVEAPVYLDPGDVRITEDGQVELVPMDETPVAPREAARGLVDVLTRLLLAAGSGVPPVLLSLVDEGTGQPPSSASNLAALRDELEASLVPLNRGAARRVLARIVREHLGEAGGPRRAAAPLSSTATTPLVPPPSSPGARGTAPSMAPAEANRAIDALFDDADLAPDEGTAPPRPWIPSQKRTLVGPGPGVETGQAAGAASRGMPARPAAAPAAPGGAGSPPRPGGSVPPPPTRARGGPAGGSIRVPDRGPRSDPPSPRPDRPQSYRPPAPDSGRPPGGAAETAPGDDDLSAGLGRFSTRPPSGNRSGLWWALVFVGLAAGLAGLVVWLRPDVLGRIRGEPDPAEEAARQAAAAREQEQEALLEAHRARYGDLVVEVSPPRSQVLLLVGTGPATAEQLPVGVAYEFVAIADGRAPARAVVPADAEWETPEPDDAPRYELAIQAGPRTDGEAGSLELGPSQLPREVGRPGSTLGTVRVVTNPRGAKVYLLIGFAPEVRVRDLPTDQPQELLVYREGYEPRRVVVEADRFADDGSGERVARLRVDLTPREAEE